MVNFLHFFYWFFIFNIGVFSLLGLPTYFYKIGIPFFCLSLIFITLIDKGSEIRLPFFGWVISFILVSIVSMVLNGIMFYTFMQFLFLTLLPYFYFIVIINENNTKRINFITRCIIILVLIQIPVIIIKYMILGQSEKGAIGTLSIGMGSISTVFPVTIIAFLISFYLFTNKMKYLILIALYILFGIIGNKRAITFIIPLEFIFGYIMYLIFFIKKVDSGVITKFILILFFGMASIYIMVRTNPTLNKEKKVWGSFDIEYLLNYSDNYSTTDKSMGKIEMRRKDGLIYFAKYSISREYSNFLFGDGAGILVQSNFDRNTGSMEQKYGVRYGGRMGVIWLLLQVGFLGVVIFLGFIMSMNRFLFKRLPIRNNYLLLGFLIATVFMLLDFLSYSIIFVATEIGKGIYFYIFGLLYLQYENLNSKGKLGQMFIGRKIKLMI